MSERRKHFRKMARSQLMVTALDKGLHCEVIGTNEFQYFINTVADQIGDMDETIACLQERIQRLESGEK